MRLAAAAAPLAAVMLILWGCGDTPVDPPPQREEPTDSATPALPGTWTSRSALPFARSEMQAATLDGKIYVVGGLQGMSNALTRVDVYDPQSDTWASAPPLPEGRHHYGMAVASGKLYVIGGYPPGEFPWTPAKDVFEFDPQTQKWRTRAPLPTGRAALMAVTVDGKVYALGGEQGGIHAGNLNQVYDPATDRWKTLAAMPSSREHLAAAVIGSTIYVVGGRVTSDHHNYWRTTTNSNALEAYDPSADTWKTLAPMPTARGGLAAAVLDGKLYAFGGEHPSVFAATEEYDPVANTWRKMKDMPVPRHGIGAAAVGDAIYVIGGSLTRGEGGSQTNEAFSAK